MVHLSGKQSSLGRIRDAIRIQDTTRSALLLFAALTLCYLALSPGSVLSQGYMDENLFAAKQIVYSLKSWLLFKHAPVPIRMPRHGIFEPVLEVPFLILGRLLSGPSIEGADRSLSIQPVVATALICTLIFVWAHKITSSREWAYMLALVAGFTTMLWPYAYIGMETTQSLFLMLSGYAALGSNHKKTWLSATAFALSCGLAIGLKGNGTFLIPAIAFLIALYFQESDTECRRKRFSLTPRYWLKTAAVGLVAAGIYLLGDYTRSLSAMWASGQAAPYRSWMVGPVEAGFNCISLLVSINKGLLIYCPVALLCLLSLKKAFRANAETTIFAGLTLGGLAIGSAMVFFWADETWGPRYLHTAVSPLILCLALAKRRLRFQPRKEIALAFLAACGLGVSFPGAFFQYDTLHTVAIRSSPSSIEELQYRINWNPILFHFKLLQVWLSAPGSSDEVWPPGYHAWPDDPNKQIAIGPVSLREYAVPQAYLVRAFHKWEDRSDLVIWWAYLVSLIAGPLLLLRIGYTCLRLGANALDSERGPYGKKTLPGTDQQSSD